MGIVFPPLLFIKHFHANLNILFRITIISYRSRASLVTVGFKDGEMLHGFRLNQIIAWYASKPPAGFCNPKTERKAASIRLTELPTRLCL